MTRWAYLGCALLLASCSDTGLNPIVGAVIREANPLQRDAPEAARPAVPQITRAAVNRADTAMIRARLVDEEARSYLVATSANGGYVTYASPIRQAMTLNGSFVTGTRGLGHDLLSARSSGPDPLVRAIPPSAWPAGVMRSYEFPAEGARGRIETYDCRFALEEISEIVILQQRHRGIQVTETCANAEGSFENLHFADLRTGFVWRSLQWTGPRQGLVDLEVVLPYTGSD